IVEGGELVGFPFDESPMLVPPEGSLNSVESWKQLDAIKGLEQELQDDSGSHCQAEF
ncbi:hypothetical protein LTR60_007094, partial [Cryomyces antarcticus]